METALIINNSIELLKEAPEILANNQTRMQNAIAVGNNIIGAIAENGMSQQLDDRCNTYLVNIRNAASEMNENRKGVTQIMDELKKMYTTIEGTLDVKKQGTIPFQIQEHRNKYAKDIAEEQLRKQQEIERERQKKEALIILHTDIEIIVKQKVLNALAFKKQMIHKVFNAINLDQFELKSKSLQAMKTSIDAEKIIDIIGSISKPTPLFTPQEINQLVNDIISVNYPLLVKQWSTELAALKQELIDKLPSKKAELEDAQRIAEEAEKAKLEAQEAERKRQEEISQANEIERKRLVEEAKIAQKIEAERQAELLRQQEAQEAVRKLREANELIRIQQEAQETERKAIEEAKLRKQGELTMNIFEQEAQLAEMQQAPATRQGYDIVVTHPVGYTLLFAFWFERDGKNLGIDKLEKTSLGQIKAWCEKYAHKSGEKIDSKFLKYEETYKAINKK
jgi:hypothetical protein